MTTFKAALVCLEKNDIAIIWMDKKYIGQVEELKKYVNFYKDLLDIKNVAIMMKEDDKDPIYIGKKEIVELLKKNFWKQYPWQQFQLGKDVK
jgi:hypothetical protein